MTLFSAMTVLFVGLKLSGFIDWNWIWVLAPLWAGFAAFLLGLAALFLISLSFKISCGLSEGWKAFRFKGDDTFPTDKEVF